MKLSAGTLLQGGKYRIEEHLGSGGFGCTYKAYYRTMRCYVAIKEFFVKDFCNREENGTVKVATQSKMELVERLRDKFLNEARTLFNTKMHHPNIVRVTDVFEENGTVYYAMDYIEGSSLAGLIAQKGCLSESEALGYIKQIAAALKHLHANNCLHLDIKPANIMIDADGKATLIDFGVSKQYDEVNGENTSTLLGHTPGYAPIEQSGRGMIKFNAACDIYALGATLYKALTGITPVDATLRAGDKSLCNLSYPEHVSPAMRNVIDKSMQISRSDRPQSVEEFLRLVESGEMKDATCIFGNASSDGSSAASQNVMPLGSQKASVAKEQESIFGNASSDGSSAASQNVMPLGSQKASVAKDESGEMKDERAKSKDETSLSMGAGQNAAADEQEDIAVEVVETPPVTPEPAPRPQPEENQKKNKWLWIIILLAVICGAAVGFMLLGGGGDDAVVKDSANKKDSVNKEITVAENTINGHEYVDLGLPSGTKWATCNVGADKPEEFGNHYAWGETETKSSYSWKTYKWCNGTRNTFTKYCSDSEFGRVDNKKRLELSDDVARKEWGSSWRMPTNEEFDELCNKNNCTWEWTTLNGVNGYKVTSKKNGNSIFLPCFSSTSPNARALNAYYWSSTPYEGNSYCACNLYISDLSYYTYNSGRFNGEGVRPVSGGAENNDTKDCKKKTNDVEQTSKHHPLETVFFTGKINGHEYVDLGLPSGLKWAICNVGASKPEGYGKHYAWGETSTKNDYSSSNSVTYNKNFSDIGGNPTYDVARKEWGSSWRMPTKAEFDELIRQCTWTWTTQNGIKGYKVTSKKNANSIFFPAAGWSSGWSLDFRGTYGNYWSSTPRESNSSDAYFLSFISGYHGTDWSVRYFGQSVRPVSE